MKIADRGGGIELARSVWIGRGGGSSATFIHLGNIYVENEALETID